MIQKNNEYIRHMLQGVYSENEIKILTQIILFDIFGINKLDYYIGKDINLSEKQQDELANILIRLRENEPIQYIVGNVSFCGLRIEVNEHVLIPRPETEELIEWILEENSREGMKVLDIGTGSGCIALTLDKKLPESELFAWDISPEALVVAAKNSEKLKSDITFRQVDILNYVPDEFEFDLIISNPPYITYSEKSEMDKNVLNWEPSTALFVPDHEALLFYNKIARLGLEMLSKSGRLYFEINRAYGSEIMEMLKGMGYSEVEIKADLSGNDRMIKAQR